MYVHVAIFFLTAIHEAGPLQNCVKQLNLWQPLQDTYQTIYPYPILYQTEIVEWHLMQSWYDLPGQDSKA